MARRFKKIASALSTAILLWPSLALSATPSSLSLGPCASSKYDELINAAVEEYWRDFNKPLWFKAQLCQESRLDPMARSPVGAQGLAQVMPATYQQIVRELHWNSVIGDVFNPERAIFAGSYYQSKTRRAWSSNGRTGVQRNDLGLCAYNRGLGNCIADQRECAQAVLWPDIAVCTARHTQETVTYVRRIHDYFNQMIASGR